MAYLFWHSIWHSSWQVLWHSIWHSIWHLFQGIFWHIFCHSFWHSICYTFYDSLWSRSGWHHSDPLLTVRVKGQDHCDVMLGSWGPAEEKKEASWHKVKQTLTWQMGNDGSLLLHMNSQVTPINHKVNRANAQAMTANDENTYLDKTCLLDCLNTSHCQNITMVSDISVI